MNELEIIASCRGIQGVLRAVSTHFGVSQAELVSRDRHKRVTLARHVAMYLCRRRLEASFPDVGRAFNRDHTTVMCAVRRIEALPEMSPVRRDIEELAKSFADSAPQRSTEAIQHEVSELSSRLADLLAELSRRAPSAPRAA